jgi:hypothetical protein
MRRLPVLVAALAAAVACAYSGYWYYLAGQLRQEVGPWVEARRAHGMAVTWQTLAVGGYPFRLRLDFSGVALSAAQPFPYTAKSALVEAEASPFRLTAWRIRAPQGATVSAPLSVAGLAAGLVEGTVAVGDDATAVTAHAGAIEGDGAAQGFAADALDLSLTLPRAAPKTDRDPFAAASVRLTAAEVPQAPRPYPHRIDTLAFAATLRGDVPAGALAQSLAQWRDGGGTLDIDSAHVVWGSTKIDLDGTLALDAGMQLQGALTATISGVDQVVDAIVAAHVMAAKYADFAKAVLHAIGRQDEDGASALHVPVTLQDRRIYVGPAPIAPLPTIEWQ